MVRTRIASYWQAFMNKRAEELADIYLPEGCVFGSLSKRPEPGRLAAARRSREYFGPGTELRSQTGQIDVLMLGEAVAVASYTFQFHASRANNLGHEEEEILNGRCSQVFTLDELGELKIAHEHMSLPGE